MTILMDEIDDQRKRNAVLADLKFKLNNYKYNINFNFHEIYGIIRDICRINNKTIL